MYSFNSKMVRLKENALELKLALVVGFNSKMVRLKDFFKRYPKAV